MKMKHSKIGVNRKRVDRLDKRKKILMIPAACGLAHTIHCACLGQVLQDMGREVYFAAKDKILDVVRMYDFRRLYKITDKNDTALKKCFYDIIKIIR